MAALDIERVPSVERLRQRMDERAEDYLPLVTRASMDFLESIQAPITALPMGYVALDADVTPFDNSGSKKEGVSLTYKKHDGYAPMACYLGQEGYCLVYCNVLNAHLDEIKLKSNPNGLSRPAGSHSSHDCCVADLEKGLALPCGLRLALVA